MSKTTLNIIRIPPYAYIHVLDTNSNVTRLVTGPNVFVKQDHENIATGANPVPMIQMPPNTYVVIENPVKRKSDGSIQYNNYGEAEVSHGDVEIRMNTQYPDPFPLYFREKLVGEIKQLQVVEENKALRIEAVRNFEDKQVGDEWLFKGPATYIPRVEQRIVSEVSATIIGPNQALKLRARKKCVDQDGTQRQAGEEWLIRKQGAYLAGIDEQTVETVKPIIITEKQSLHLRAIKTFQDVYGKTRKAGEEWIVTYADTEFHILDVYEEKVKNVEATLLSNTQYCVVLDPVDEKGVNQLGTKDLRKGPLKFFLKPGEALEGGIKNMYVLGEDQALLLKADEKIEDKQPGDKWMIYGPCSFIPPTQVTVVEVRRSIPLHLNEGVYVRDTKTGAVRAVFGQTYMLQAHEELWEMELPESVEKLLEGENGKKRDKTRVVTYKCPYNAVCQIYDYKTKKSRVVCGPDLVMLNPDESFTVSVLSGGKPKRPGLINTLHILLGPDFSTDIITVETANHARLKLQLSYNWHFAIDKKSQDQLQEVFHVRDFVGNICNTMASKIRGAVASTDFDDFHKQSARLIRKSIFGLNSEGKINDLLKFTNILHITNVDIQSVEPVDQWTRESLQKTVTLAIEITTRATEAQARHQAEQAEQEARGQLERQVIEDQAKAEEARKQLLELQGESKGIQSQGKAIAEAKARAEAQMIEGNASVQTAQLKSSAKKINMGSDLELLKKKQELELTYMQQLDELQITKEKELSEIESNKFQEIINALGQETLVALSEAGPKAQAEIMQGLGLSGYLIMDSKSPLNLFTTAQGMIDTAAHQP